MQITIISGEIGDATSGQSRFGINLAKGLRRLDHQVSICAGSMVPSVESALRSNGVEVHSLARGSEGEARKARFLTPFSNLGRALAEFARSKTDPDWFVVVSDAAVGAGKHLEPKRRAFVCNGDLSLLFVHPGFYRSHRNAKRLWALGMSTLMRQNAESAKHYDVLLANSEFTRQFMSYLYALPFQGVVYPPVDTAQFTPPSSIGSAGQYVGAMARNASEQGLDLLTRLAPLTDLRIVGGAEVAGARSLGTVPEAELVDFYGRARFLAFPVVSEFFGYAIAESHACGTPVLAYDCCGASEQIRHGVNGWLARTEEDFVDQYRALCTAGVPPEMRSRCRADSASRSVETSSRQLLSALGAEGPPSGSPARGSGSR
jgi:glycosyltransferase involved in cell wall biosynthesis